MGLHGGLQIIEAGGNRGSAGRKGAAPTIFRDGLTTCKSRFGKSEVPCNAVQYSASGRGAKELLLEKLGPPVTLVFAFNSNSKEALTMCLSYREDLVVAMRELLPPRFFRGGGSAAGRSGRRNGRCGWGC